MDILKLLKQGWSPEDIMEEFDEAMRLAQVEYEKYLEAERKAEAERAAAALALEYKKLKQEEAREALGAALIDFALAYELVDEVDEDYISSIEKYIDLLKSPAQTVCVGARGSKSNGKVIIYG